MAQWKRAGPITQRSVDRNYALLNPFFREINAFFYISRKNVRYLNLGGCFLGSGFSKEIECPSDDPDVQLQLLLHKEV